MQILIKILSGEIITLEVEPNHTIEDIKKLIQEKIGWRPEQQKLIFKSDILNDHLTIYDYNIENKSSLYVIHTAPSSSY